MKTNNIWANKMKAENQFEEFNQLRDERTFVENAQLIVYSLLLFLAGFVSCYVFTR